MSYDIISFVFTSSLTSALAFGTTYTAIIDLVIAILGPDRKGGIYHHGNSLDIPDSI
jgi:hypothetical protein